MAADYVIVGAGSAGCVLAARLSEDPGRRGAAARGGRAGHGDRAPHPGDVPARLQVRPRLGSVRRARAGPRRPPAVPAARARDRRLGLDQRDDLPPRPSRRLRRAGRRTGCTGWSYDEVLPYFKRSEDNERGASEFHGVGGPLTVSDSRSMCPLIEAQLEAAVQAGYAHIEDLNVDRPEGVSRFQLTQRNGMRCSTADAFLHPAEGRPNLEVRAGVFVERIVFEGDRAVGVELVSGRRPRDRPGRARGDRLRGHVPVAGAADALGDRRPPRTSGSSGSRCARTCRSGTTCRTTAWSTSTTSRTSRGCSASSRPRTSRSSSARAAARSPRTTPRRAASSVRGRASTRRTSSSISRRRRSSTRA